MNQNAYNLMLKNVKQWSARIAKLEKKAERTEDEAEELEMRKSQVGIWKYQLKHSSFAEKAAPGDMSASAGATSAESASVG